MGRRTSLRGRGCGQGREGVPGEPARKGARHGEQHDGQRDTQRAGVDQGLASSRIGLVNCPFIQIS